MLYRIEHTTTYEYSETASLCHNLAHLTPRKTARQACRDCAIEILPEPAAVDSLTDYFGNTATFFAVQERHLQMTVTARHKVDEAPVTLPDPAQSPAWETVRELLQVDRNLDSLDAAQFAYDSRYVPSSRELEDYAAASFSPGRPLLSAVFDLMTRIHNDFIYDTRATTVATSLPEVFAIRRGVCQDFSHLQIGCLRSLGLAARYVSGYLCTEHPAGAPALVGADATHAWLAVYCPGAGWVDFDPTNNQAADERYITLAWGRDYDDVCPLRGIVLGGGQHRVRVEVRVRRERGINSPATQQA
ncbi:MAG: transglutaminase family protein [Planctomycetaceae bacterium]